MLRKFLPLLILGILAFFLAVTLMIWKPFDSFTYDSSDIGGDDVKTAEIEPDPNQPSYQNFKELMDQIRLAEISLKDATLEEAIEFLRIRSNEGNPFGGGVSFVIQSPQSIEPDESRGLIESREDQNYRKITLEASDVSFTEALDLICQQANAKWKIDEFAVTIMKVPSKSSSSNDHSERKNVR